MENQISTLKEHLLQLLDPRTTPEKALKSLTHPCFKPETYTKIEMEAVIIFLAYIRFIIKRRPDGCVEGIWEKILRKTLLFSKNISITDINLFHGYSVQNGYTGVVPPEELPLSIWVKTVLCSNSKGLDPYIRLELFRLLRIYQQDWQSGFGNTGNWKPICYINLKDWGILCETFIRTISEIQPHRLYPSGNGDDLMFCVTDMDLFLRKVYNEAHFEINSNDIVKNLKKRNEAFINSMKTRFITHCIQLVGVFSVLAKSNAGFDKYITEIIACFHVLKITVNIGGILRKEGVSKYAMERHYIVSLPPFRDFTFEALFDLSKATMNSCERKLTLPLAYLREIFVWYLRVCTKASDLTGLFLSRQTEGPTAVHQHLLLFGNLTREKINEFDFEDDDDWLDTFIETYMEEYLPHGERNSENGHNISRSSDSDDNSLGDSLSSFSNVPDDLPSSYVNTEVDSDSSPNDASSDNNYDSDN